MSGGRDTKITQAAPGSAEVSRLASIGSNRFSAAQGSSTFDVHDALSNAIRTILLPRMIAAHRKDAAAIGETDVELLLSHVTTADPALAEGLLTAVRQRGVSRADVLLDLFAVVARRLGDRWRRDECTFAEATLAAGRLRRLIRSEGMPAPPPVVEGAGRVLIASFPSDQHALDAAIAEDVFRSSGWTIAAWSGTDAAALDIVATTGAFDIMAMSVGDAEQRDRLPSLAARLRRASPARLIGIMTGGRAGLPGDLGRLGLDAVIRDLREADSVARALLKS
jgi:MerR family transcriptional regulator, light-induced transcriptional regulator